VAATSLTALLRVVYVLPSQADKQFSRRHLKLLHCTNQFNCTLLSNLLSSAIMYQRDGHMSFIIYRIHG